MFVFMQFYKSNKAATYTQKDFTDILDARNYAETLLHSSVDVAVVHVFRQEGSVSKVEVSEWQ